MKCRLLTWEEIHSLAYGLAKKISDSEFRPDAVIALARGGLVPARAVSDFLGIRDLLSLKVEHWGFTAKKDAKANLRYKTPLDVEGKRVLILDDCVDTGQSLKVAREWVSGFKPEEIRTAVLHIFDTTPRKLWPDFWVEKLPWTWLIYPWNAIEDGINLILEVLKERKRIELPRLEQYLLESYGFVFPEHLLDRVLERGSSLGKFRIDGDFIKNAGPA